MGYPLGVLWKWRNGEYWNFKGILTNKYRSCILEVFHIFSGLTKHLFAGQYEVIRFHFKSTILHKNNQRNHKFSKKVAFLRYMEKANLRPQSREADSKQKPHRWLDTRLPSSWYWSHDLLDLSLKSLQLYNKIVF